MKSRFLSHFDIIEAKKSYLEGKNITEVLRSQKHVIENTSEIIETAYDLQAGNYIEYTINNYEKALLYTTELADIIDKHVKQDYKILDIGTGELTTLSLMILALNTKPRNFYAFDISWSRLYKGLAFAKDKLGAEFQIIKPFVADIEEIPLLDKSIDITISSHALEPNGGKLKELLIELFRVTVEKIILFEPFYEINSREGKERMDRLGYVRNIEGIVNELGGIVSEKILIKNVVNPLNPTACFIVELPFVEVSSLQIQREIFSLPGTNIALDNYGDCFYSPMTGLCYPILRSIPILRSNCSILASSLSDSIE